MKPSGRGPSSASGSRPELSARTSVRVPAVALCLPVFQGLRLGSGIP